MTSFYHRAGFARETVAATLLIGIALHTIALFIGRERFVEEIFTPKVDRVILLLMAYGAIAALVFRHAFDLSTRARRVGFISVVTYLIVSVPFHIRAVLQGSTEFVLAFPSWYSAVIIPVQATFLVITLRAMKLQPARAPATAGILHQG